jgi:hypothetical protein
MEKTLALASAFYFSVFQFAELENTAILHFSFCILHYPSVRGTADKQCLSLQA